jgi:hypothetical protein
VRKSENGDFAQFHEVFFRDWHLMPFGTPFATFMLTL